MDVLDELLKRYTDKFNDNFPIFMVRDMPEYEIVKAIKKAIEENKAFVVEVEENCLY